MMRVGIHTEDAPFLKGKSCVLNNTTLSSGMKTFFKHNIYPITVLTTKTSVYEIKGHYNITNTRNSTYKDSSPDIHTCMMQPATYIHRTYIKHV